MNEINRRKQVGMSQADFARKCGVSPQFISKIEKGYPMPLRIKIEYLKLNPTDKDLIIIDYLEKELK